VDIDVILVADIDLLSDMLFTLRQLGNEPGSGINLNFDNVTFVLNAIDSIAGDERFLEVRSRRPVHRTLSKFDEHTDVIRRETMDTRRALQQEYEEAIATAQQDLEEEMARLRQDFQRGAMNEPEAARRLAAVIMTKEKHLTSEKERLQRQLSRDMAEAEVKLNEHISYVQGRYKLWSVDLPPIPPLVIALTVLFVRRIRESEGVPVSRRRK